MPSSIGYQFESTRPEIDGEALQQFSECFHFSRSEEHTSELQSRVDLVCRLLLEKKKLNRLIDARPLGPGNYSRERRRSLKGSSRLGSLMRAQSLGVDAEGGILSLTGYTVHVHEY